MDIKGSNKKDKDAPTPFNTPRNAAPIQGGKKGGNQPQVGSFTGSLDLPPQIQQAILANPDLAQMVGDKLSSIVGMSTGFPTDFPAPIRRRLNALKNIQDEQVELEAKFREEILALEAKYHDLYKPLYAKRTNIVSGKTEPTPEEFHREGEEDPEDEEEEVVEEQPKGGKGGKGKGGKGGAKESPKKPKKEEIKGIPEFWATILRNHPLVAETIQEHDLDIISSLQDVTLKYIDNNLAFVLEFHWAPNQYFTNTVLTKTYYLQNNVSAEFDDVIYARSEGCTIDWKQGKDVTTRTETKKQKNKANKKTRIVKKTVPQESFFRFFSPPTPPADEDEEEEPEDEDEEGPSLADRLDMDFELGEVLKAKLIPRAVDWFTGEALQYDDENGYDEDYDDEDMYGDEDDEEDDEEDAPRAKGKKIREIKEGGDEDEDDEDDDEDDEAPAGQAGTAAKPGEKPAECNQQ